MSLRGEWNLIPFEPAYRTRVLELMAVVQGHRMSEQEFEWEFERNPFGSLNIFLATIGTEVIGVSCHNAFRIRLGEEVYPCSFPLNVLTHPEHRGKGIFSKLELRNEERATELGFPFMLSFPNDASTGIFLGRLGWSRLAPPMIVGRPCLHRSRRDRLDDLVAIDRFDERVDGLEFVSRENEVSFARDHEYLNWRFLERPGDRYRAFMIKRRERLAGYIVVGTTQKRGKTIRFVAACRFTEEVADVYASARAQGLRELSTAGFCLEMDTVTANRPVARQLLNGFVPVPKRLNVIFKPLAPSAPDLSRRPLRWFIDLGDLDFF